MFEKQYPPNKAQTEIKEPQVETANVSRRDFLQNATRLAALAVATAIPGCKEKKAPSKKSKPKTAALPEIIEDDKYKLPKVEYKPSTTFTDPDLPQGLDASELPVLRKKVVSQVENYFKSFKDKKDGARIAYGGITMMCLNLIQNLHPAFSNYLPVLQRKCRSNAGCLFEYVNKFLVPEKKYLYTRAGQPHTKANFYDIRDSKDVIIDDVKETQAHFVVNGMLKDENKSDTISQIMEGEDYSIVVWPEIIDVRKKKFHKRLKITDPKRKKKIEDELDRGTLFHEALHINLFRKYPSILQIPFDIRQAYKVDSETTIKLGGAMQYNIIHELCAIAGELQTATDPAIMLGFVSEKKPITPQYRFAMYLVFLSSIKHLADNDPFKKEKLKAISDNPNNLKQIFNSPEMAKFYRKNADLSLINRVGKELYKIGIDIIEKIYRKSEEIKMSRIQ